MIETSGLTKRFDDITAVDHIDAKIKEGSVFGLIGTNGAGKSTFLRMVSGILKPDEGTVLIDGENVYENPKVKSKFFYISDDQYFFANGTPVELMKFYKTIYPAFDEPRFFHLLESFDLGKKRKISTFSKGMKKQLSIIYGICAGTDYIFCDETFDGLDPVMRQAVKSLFASEIMNREFTPVIASHNLRELEDICDHVGLLHKGGILLSKDLEDMKFHIHKIQCVLGGRQQEKELEKELQVLKVQHQGSLLMITARGTRSEIVEKVQAKNPLFMEVLPLTLEEIFISETEVAGYEIKNLF